MQTSEIRLSRTVLSRYGYTVFEDPSRQKQRKTTLPRISWSSRRNSNRAGSVRNVISRVYDVLIGRRDAEQDERSTWLTLLADFLKKSFTPLGLLLCEGASDKQLLGPGLKAVTLRCGVRVLRNFFCWLAATYDLRTRVVCDSAFRSHVWEERWSWLPSHSASWRRLWLA